MKQASGKLTRETYTALLHTSNALIEITEQYRQLAGGKYDVSLRQGYKCEKKIRLLTVLKLPLQNREMTLEDFSLNWNTYEHGSAVGQQYSIQLTTEEVNKDKEMLPVLTYIAGYCCYSVSHKLNCKDCKERIVNACGNDADFQVSVIKGLSRGRLLYPTQDVIDMVLVCYLTITKLSEIDAFYRAQSQRTIAVNSCLAVLDGEYMLHVDQPSFCNTHNYTDLVKMIVWVCTNTFLNNLCFKKNDAVCTERLAKRRKLRTLTVV